MTRHHTVGMNIGNRAHHVTVEAEDALIAALRVKNQYPEALITYVRRTNRRGDRLHPHKPLSKSE